MISAQMGVIDAEFDRSILISANPTATIYRKYMFGVSRSSDGIAFMMQFWHFVGYDRSYTQRESFDPEYSVVGLNWLKLKKSDNDEEEIKGLLQYKKIYRKRVKAILPEEIHLHWANGGELMPIKNQSWQAFSGLVGDNSAAPDTRIEK